jgi:hypothetical protein
VQYAQTKPHSVDRKISNNTSRKITAYHAKPKGSSGNNTNTHVHAHAHAHGHAHGQNTILVSTLNSHNNNNNNNTTQSSQYNMDLSLTSSMKHNNNDVYNSVSKTKQIKQKLISVAKNSDNGVNHYCNSHSSKIKSSSQQKQKIPSRNIRNSSVIKNTINRTQNTSNCQCKKGNNSGNCYSNTINSHTHASSKKKLFTNSMNVNHAISTMMNELKAKQVKK